MGGITVGEINKLELEFLILLDFDLFVSDTELSKVASRLEIFSHDRIPTSPLVIYDTSPCITPLALASPEYDQA